MKLNGANAKAALGGAALLNLTRVSNARLSAG